MSKRNTVKKTAALKHDNQASNATKDGKLTREQEDSIMSDSLDDLSEDSKLTKCMANPEFQMHHIMGKFKDISKDMLKSAIDQLRPEFEQIAEKAVVKAVELRDKKVQELEDKLNCKEKQLKQLQLEKQKLTANEQQNASIIKQKDMEIKCLQKEIEDVKLELKRRQNELRKEKARVTEEEGKRLELEKHLNEEIAQLQKKLNKAVARGAMMKAANNIGEGEIKRLRERVKELQAELDRLKFR